MRSYWIFLLVLLSGTACASEESSSQPNNTIEVFGSGVAMSVPDRFSFSLSIEQKGQQASELNQLITVKTEKIVNALLEIGIDKRAIQSLQVQFSPWVEYNGQSRIQKGFSLTRTMTVTVNQLTQYDKAIDTVLSLGISQIYAFTSDSSQSESYYQAALREALMSAKQRATDMAKTMGLKLGEVISISELSSGGPSPVFARARQMSQSESYQPGEMGTDARVKVVFALINTQ